MNIDIVRGMISNSTWRNTSNENVFKFANDKSLFINGKNLVKYSLYYTNNKIVLELGSNLSYYVDYVNDFILNLYNDAEEFSITPY